MSPDGFVLSVGSHIWQSLLSAVLRDYFSNGSGHQNFPCFVEAALVVSLFSRLDPEALNCADPLSAGVLLSCATTIGRDGDPLVVSQGR